MIIDVDLLTLIAVFYLLIGLLITCFIPIHELYFENVPRKWVNIESAIAFSFYFLCLGILLEVQYINLLIIIYISIWPINLFRYYRKFKQLPDENEMYEEFKLNGLESIFTSPAGNRQKYNTLMKINAYQNGIQKQFEKFFLKIVEENEIKYQPFFDVILSKLTSEDFLKKAFINDKHIDFEGKSKFRKAIIERIRELIGIESDRFLFELVKEENEPLMILDYIKNNKIAFEIHQWAVEKDQTMDHNYEIANYIEKKFKNILQ